MMQRGNMVTEDAFRRELRLHRLRDDWHLLVTHADTGCGNMVGQRDSKKIQTLDNNRRSPEHRHTLAHCGRLSPFSDSSFHSYTFFPPLIFLLLFHYLYIFAGHKLSNTTTDSFYPDPCWRFFLKTKLNILNLK